MSTAIPTPGSAARMPDAYGADGSITTSSIASRNALVCSASQSRTQPPVRPGANPSNDPGPIGGAVDEADVSHGSDRLQVIPSRIQRTDRNRVSSIPNRLVGSGSGSQRAAAATSDLCAVGHDTPYSRATSDTARFAAGDRVATRSRSRSVTRATRPDRVTGLGERPPRTQRLDADQPAFPPPQLASAAPTPPDP